MMDGSKDEEAVVVAVSSVGGALLRVGERYLVGWFSDNGVTPKRDQVVVGRLDGVGPRTVALGVDARPVTLVIDENDLERTEAEQLNWL